MNLKKNLFLVKKCPICKEKEFINHGMVNGLHPDLLRLCDLMECKTCQHWFISKMPKALFIENLYKKSSEYVLSKEYLANIKNKDLIKKSLKSKNFNTNNWIYKFMKNYKKGNYLEIGPGDCNLLRTFRNHGWHCEGLELQKCFKIKGVVNDIKKISKKNKNVIVFQDVLEHVVDPLSFLKKIGKHQKSGGKLFLAFPNSSSFKAKILKSKWSMIAPLGHLNFFSINSTKILLEKSGYSQGIIRETSFVIVKKLLRSIVRLPITLFLDLVKFNILIAFKRFPEIFLNILDLIKGDQINVIATKK